MINRLIDVALRNRFIVVVLYLGLAGWGWWALASTPIDAIPDLSDNQVIVFTDWPGHSPQEVEDQVTYPLTTNLQGLAGVRVVRSQSAFGFSMIYVVFEDDVDLYFARTRVLERMSLLAKSLPTGVTRRSDRTRLASAMCSGTRSRARHIHSGAYGTLQDWFIRYQLNAVPGVAEVASVGGHVQQYQVDVDPNRLRAYNLPLSAVVSAVRDSNLNVGGNVLESNGAWLIVRGVGLITSVDDVKRIVVGDSNGVPDLRRAGRKCPDRPRLSRGVTRQGDTGSCRRCHRRPHRRQHEKRHRRRQGAHRANPAWAPAGRHHRAVL